MPLVASSFDSLLRATFFRAHSRLQLKADLLVQSVNVAELPRARYCSNAAVFPVELTVRTEARHHRRRRGPVGTTTDTGSARRPPTSSLVSRAPESGLRTVQSTRRQRPGDQRYEPGHLTSVVDHAVSTRQPTVTSATATCSGGVNVVAPLLRCSAAPLAALVTFTFYVRLPLFFPSFSYSPLGPSCFPLLLYP